jgi:hypothetical protein
MQRHRHQEFIRFLNTIEAKVPAGKIIHAVIDNYATHKHPKVLRPALSPALELAGVTQKAEHRYADRLRMAVA